MNNFNTFTTLIIPKKFTSDIIKYLIGIEEALGIPSHFKRVKPVLNETSMNEVLIYNSTVVDSDKGKEVIDQLIAYLELKNIPHLKLDTKCLPIESPNTKEDYDEKVKIWPMTYVPVKVPELSNSEIQAYLEIIEDMRPYAIDDHDQSNNFAILLDDLANETLIKIICKQKLGYPLDHAVIQVINQYSNNYLLKDKKRYLLTNLTLITRIEPCMMCSMALVHSRIKRVIYLEPNKNYLGALNKQLNINTLGVNHKYEVFEYNAASNKFTVIN